MLLRVRKLGKYLLKRSFHYYLEGQLSLFMSAKKSRGMISAIQKTDPRCEPTQLSAEDNANLKALQAAMAAN